MHIARVYGRGSLVKLRGPTRIKFLRSAHLCWRDATRAAVVRTALPCWPAPQELSFPPPAAVVGGLTGAAAVVTVQGNYRQSALFVCLVSTGKQRACVEMCVRARYRAISGRRDIARLTNPRSISRYRVIDMNPTAMSCQGRATRWWWWWIIIILVILIIYTDCKL